MKTITMCRGYLRVGNYKEYLKKSTHDVYNHYIDATFLYKTITYKGEFSNEKLFSRQETQKADINLDTMDRIFYINGRFVLIHSRNQAIWNQEDIGEYECLLSTVFKFPKVRWSRRNTTPLHTILQGNTVSIQGLLSERDIKTSYKELNYRGVKYGKKVGFDPTEAIDDLAESISKYLFLDLVRFKRGTFNLADQLIKRINYNITQKQNETN